jgi:uncharacterized protein with von Willebrand factor type A (vWA) domain
MRKLLAVPYLWRPGGKAGQPGGPGDDMAGEMATMRAVVSALKDAQQQVEEMQDAASACGMGSGAPGSNDPKAIAQVFRRIRGNAMLKRICELAGRYRRLAQSRQRQKALHGYDDMVGVVMDGDVGRLLPHELAMLADPEFEDDAMRRLVERQSMCREYRGVEPVAKGPVVVVVDESGSMRNDHKIETAKALALAMAWVARHQKRWCALVAFAGGTAGRTLVLPPGRWNDHALMNWLEEMIGGGTECDVPLVELPNRYWPEFLKQGLQRGKTDVICITDGIIEVPSDVRDNFIAWKQREKARMTTLAIGTESRGSLEGVSDEVFCVPSLDVNETAVQKVLSI